jgi:uncharacterized membrane protein
VRHFMNVRYHGQVWLWPAFAMAALAIGGLMVVTRLHVPAAFTVNGPVGFARAQEIIVKRCVPCHSSHPRDELFPVPPNNVVFETAEQIAAMAPRIKERAVVSRTMPFLNRTEMTIEERAELGAWIEAGAQLK